MATSKKPNTVEIVTALAEPVVQEMGLQLWDVRCEKEGASWYLRLFIDKEGGVTINDCEDLSRMFDKILDEADPISQSYYFEVSSPGIDRPLRTPEHFARFAGETVTVKTTGPIDGRSAFTGELLGFEDGCVIVAADGADTFRIPYDNIKKARVKGTIDFSA